MRSRSSRAGGCAGGSRARCRRRSRRRRRSGGRPSPATTCSSRHRPPSGSSTTSSRAPKRAGRRRRARGDASDRPDRGERRAARELAGAARRDGGDPHRVAGIADLPAAPHRPRRRSVRDAEAAHDGLGRRAPRRRPRRELRRSAHHSRRARTAALLARRAAEPRERDARRDVTRGPAPDDPGPGGPVHAAAASPSRGEAGHHRLGADQWARLAAVARADRARHLVRRPPHAAARHGDPVEDRAAARLGRGALQGRSWRMEAPDGRIAVLLTGVGKRYDIVSAFAEHAFVIAADPSPLAPARYAAHVRAAPPRIDDPRYVPFLEELVERYDVRAVVPLTDLDIEVLASAPGLPAFTPAPEVCRATYDKYETHELLLGHGLPSPPTVLPGTEPDSYPVLIKPRRGSGARSIHPAADREEMEFFVRYVQKEEPVMVQRLMGGDEFSIDILCDLDGRCRNAIPRTMIESRGGESIKGTVIADDELVDLGRTVGEALGVRGPCTVQAFRDPEIGLGITDVNTRFGGAFPGPMYAALPGRTYPELIVRMAAGERIEPHVGDFKANVTFTRGYWQIELDEALPPPGRDILPNGFRPPRVGQS